MAKGKAKSCAERLVEHFTPKEGSSRGAMVKAARALETYRQMVQNWVNWGHIPPNWALKVEQATDGSVTAREILEEYERKFPNEKVAHPYAAG